MSRTFAVAATALLGRILESHHSFSELAPAAGIDDATLLSATAGLAPDLPVASLRTLARLLDTPLETLLDDPAALTTERWCPSQLQAVFVPFGDHDGRLALWGYDDPDALDAALDQLDIDSDEAGQRTSQLPVYLPGPDGRLETRKVHAVLVAVGDVEDVLPDADTCRDAGDIGESVTFYAALSRTLRTAHQQHPDDGVITPSGVDMPPAAHALAVAEQMAGPGLVDEFARRLWRQLDAEGACGPVVLPSDVAVRTVVRIRLDRDVRLAPFTAEILVGPTNRPDVLVDVADAVELGPNAHAHGFKSLQRLRALLQHHLPAHETVRLRTERVSRLIAAASQLAEQRIFLDLPDTLTQPRQVSTSVTIERDTPTHGGVEPFAALTATVEVDGRTLADSEVAALLGDEAGLAQLASGWVVLNPDDRAKVRAATKAVHDAGQMGPAHATAVALAGEVDAGGVIVELRTSAARQELVAAVESVDLDAAPDLSKVTMPLFDHQLRGVSWLQQMASRGWGTLLADDVGVGKTPQTLALLASRDGPHLVIVPLSVLSNWVRESGRFAAGLTPHIHHGPDRSRDLDVEPGTVVFTTYQTATSDADMLAGIGWDVVVLDEAAKVKNARTLASQAVRSLPAQARVALTATPVENSLTDMWAISTFLNPGLLGSDRAFRASFARPVADGDRDCAARLQRILAPFQLRRDKEQAGLDVPPIRLHQRPCSLTGEQAQLYQAALTRIGDGFGDGFERSGHIFALMTALKQICNHPENLRFSGGEVAGRSGKLAVCEQLVGAAVADGRKVLVFTQYVEMGKMLATRLGEVAGTDVALYHGGLAARHRDEIVRRFQEDDTQQVLVLSTRAGDVGLNLTAASVVVHYDRLWNPATEQQANGRAHRIGQDRDVDVYELVVTGTLEERIVALLSRKRRLADAVRGSATPRWDQLTDAELVELTALSATALEEAA